jgi:hypothetical protein
MSLASPAANDDSKTGDFGQQADLTFSKPNVEFVLIPTHFNVHRVEKTR